MHAGSWQSLHLGPGVSVIVPARPRAGRGGRRASSVVCAGERQVRAWNRPGGGSGGPRRERVGVCDRYGRTVVPTARRLYRDCFRSTSTVDTYSRTYRGTYSLTTHEYRHYTSQTDTNLDRGAHVATPAPLERAARFARFAPARVTFLTVTFRHGPRISLPSPRWLRPRTSPAAVRAIATTTMLPTRAGR